MTSSQIPSRIPIKRPFAEDGLLTSIADTDGDTLNYPTGFPSVYSVPASSGGKYLGRGDINAIGNIATNDLFYHKCGGLNTFDADFAAKVGGYPKGAILKFVNGTYVYDVISLVDNNKVDFTGAMPTTAQQAAGIVAGSIDNANWMYCNRDVAVSDRLTLFTTSNVSSIFNVEASSARAVPIGCFLSSKSGPIIPSVQVSVAMSGSGTASSRNASYLSGFGLIAYDLGASNEGYDSLTYPIATSLGDWKLVYSNSLGTGFNYGAGGCHITGIISNITAMEATYGHYYVFAYYSGSGQDSTFIGAGAGTINGSVTTTVSSISVYID